LHTGFIRGVYTIPWSGGVYTRGYPSWTADANSNLPISATKFDTEDSDFASGISFCLNKDGTSGPTSPLTWTQALTVNTLSVTANSPIPANGLYLPGGTSLGFSTASTQRGTIDATGHWTIAGPSSGSATGFTVSTNALFNGSTTTANTLNLTSTGGNGYLALESSVGGATFAGTAAYATVVGSNNSTELDWVTAGSTRAKITSAGQMSAIDDSGTMQIVGWRDLIYRNITTNYAPVLADRGANICNNSASPVTVTIPANASVAFPLGTTLSFSTVNGGGAVTIALTSDTLIWAAAGSTGTRTLATTGLATATKVANTQWLISGSGLS
jgi:hypothetical protein